MAPPLRDELIVDRATQNSARNRFDTLNKESNELDAQSRQLGEAYETMIRIQDRYFYHLSFNAKWILINDSVAKHFAYTVPIFWKILCCVLTEKPWYLNEYKVSFMMSNPC